MINSLISPSPDLSSQETCRGSHCMGVEMLNLIALTRDAPRPKARASRGASMGRVGMMLIGVEFCG